jgi:hypothetical protein
MCIERNREILFGRRGEKLRLTVTSATAAAMQLVLPNPTTLAIPATAGLVHWRITLFNKLGAKPLRTFPPFLFRPVKNQA